jgi:hypothetical protein
VLFFCRIPYGGEGRIIESTKRAVAGYTGIMSNKIKKY